MPSPLPTDWEYRAGNSGQKVMGWNGIVDALTACLDYAT